VRHVNWEPFITCAVTGAGDSAGKHPGLPVTPAEIAEAAISAAREGAAIVHLHVRDPDTGEGSRRLDLYHEAVEHIRGSGTDVLINLTTGMGGDMIVGPSGAEDTPAPGSDLIGADARLEHVAELRPDICSLDCGSMNFDDDSLVYVMPPAYLRANAARIRQLSVKPELEVFDLGQLVFVKRMINEGLIDAPPMIQICLGIPYGAPATTQAMQSMAADLPEGAVWSGFAIGRMEMPMVAQAMLLGGNIRVGLEDNLYLDRGVLASNADLVARAREIVERLGGRVAGTEEARERLALPSRAG
jgi:3-dehydrocarnitine:acetyl-CoA trimethylamine transferase